MSIGKNARSKNSPKLAARVEQVEQAQEGERVVVRNSTSMPRTRSQTQLPEGPTYELNEEISFYLDIETTDTAPCNGVLLNRFEQPDSEMKSLHATPPMRYDEEDEDGKVELTPEEQAEPGFVGKTLTLEAVWVDMESRSKKPVAETRKTYNNERGFFTVKDVVEAVEDFERIDRPKSKWHGGIDCHHVRFEGLSGPRESGAYGIYWGS